MAYVASVYVSEGLGIFYFDLTQPNGDIICSIRGGGR